MTGDSKALTVVLRDIHDALCALESPPPVLDILRKEARPLFKQRPGTLAEVVYVVAGQVRGRQQRYVVHQVVDVRPLGKKTEKNQ